MKLRTEVIVVGAGIAGMAFAHRLVNAAEPGSVRVRLLLKAPMTSSSSQLAQGGLAAALHATDSVEAHVQDTLRTGGGRNNEAVVRAVVAEGPRVVEELLALGAELDRDAAGKLRLAREGGHGRARVVHHADRTGAEIVRVLDAHTRAHPAIERVEGMRALDLLVEEEDGAPRCTGVQVLRLEDGMLCELRAHLVVLATGGVGQVYPTTTNPTTATGDGIAMALRAGVPLRDMAFVQFHPTALHTGEPGQAFLISEAVRGAGARLLRHDGTPLMEDVHPMGDLAPRHVVAHTLHQELVRSGRPHAWLDAGPIGMARFALEFPAIDRWCEERGLVPGRDRLPVAPAAHYLCGGIATDGAGRTALPGLLALGECAGTGMHGADRLASNSLLEALVVPGHAVQALRARPLPQHALPADREVGVKLSRQDPESVDQLLAALHHAMITHVGLERTTEGLRTALRSIARCERHLRTIWLRRRWGIRVVDLRDLLATARAITEAALEEPVPVGAHFRHDDRPARKERRAVHDHSLTTAIR